ncbi:cupin domain-containing protein [Mycobacterium sp. JS623]|uniref:cupin domain-containing protein n=1 Tax=Mycobacterium sp. JS623 TaxID=212767 RepID=UPI0002A59407|nr:cupin domain-containing protein [Mycobacterium sp. JS623]AGB22239.1 cupin domain-containing protein [Mycobacterium sp. JS623]
MDTRLLRNRPAYVLDRQTAPAMWLVETLWLFHATAAQTGNRFSLIEQVMGGGLGPPTHRHPLAVENFVVLEGVVDFHIDGGSVRADPGTFLHIPRMKPHTFTVETAEARVLNFYAPAGNELNVMGLARPAEERRRPSMAEGPLPAGFEYIEITAQLYGSHPVAALPFGVKPSHDLIDTPADAWAVGDTHVVRAVQAPVFEAFGARWRVLADSRDTERDYDLLDALVPEGAGPPRRVLGTDETIYVLDGVVSVEVDETSTEIGAGSFAYAPAGSLCSWHAQAGGAHVLVFHLPGGFDRALAKGRGEDALVQAWDEARGTRYLRPQALQTPAVPPVPDDNAVIV